MSLLANDTFLDINNLLGGLYSTNTTPVRRAYRQRPNRATLRNTSDRLDPRVDILKNDEGYQLIAELPGISKEQLSVTVEESTLTIETKSVEQQTDSKPDEEKGQYLRRERLNGNFRRSFDLGQDIELSDIKASFKDGLLTLDIPKQKEQTPTSRNIDIH